MQLGGVNQAHEEVADVFARYSEDNFSAREVRTYKTQERSHGRQERREYYIAPAPQELSGKAAWKDLHSLGMVVRYREVAGKESVEVAYYIPEPTDNTIELCTDVNGVERCDAAIQTNNVNIDDRGYVYAVDRSHTGLHIVELTGEARELVGL